MKHEVRMELGELKHASIGVMAHDLKPRSISFRFVDKDGNAIVIETTPGQARDIANQVNTKVEKGTYSSVSFMPWT